ncbi:MAG: type IV pilin-like G/H family protein [Microcystaceae cyanobacterium]
MKDRSPIFRSLVYIALGTLALFLIPVIIVNLMSSVGKARESEAKSTLGAINRAQQTYYSEYKKFGSELELLESESTYVHLENFKFYKVKILGGDLRGLAIARGIDNQKNETRDYIAGVNYNKNTK